MAKANKMIDAKPGGKDWDDASPTARVLAAAIYELSSDVGHIYDLAMAVDHKLDHTAEFKGLSEAIEAGFDRLSTAITEATA